ncbi:MAG: hypothetical protein ACE5K4_02715 [Candidatus Hydrothermarchaeota archaeon]
MSSRFDAKRRRTVRKKKSNAPLIAIAAVIIIAAGAFSYLYLLKPKPPEKITPTAPEEKVPEEKEVIPEKEVPEEKVPEEKPPETKPPEEVPKVTENVTKPAITFVKKIVLILPKYNLPSGLEFSKEIGPTFPLANTKHTTGVYTLNGNPVLFVHIIEGPDNASVKTVMNPILQDMGISGTGREEKIEGYKVTFYEEVAGKPEIVYVSYLNQAGVITTGSGAVTKDLLREVTSRVLKGEIGAREIVRVITLPEPPRDDLPEGVAWGRHPRNPIITEKRDAEGNLYLKAYTGIYSANGKGLYVHIVRGKTLEDTQKEIESRLRGMGAYQASKSTETINWIPVTKYTNAQGEYNVFGYIYTWYKGDTGFIVDAVEGVSEDTVVSMVKRVME